MAACLEATKQGNCALHGGHVAFLEGHGGPRGCGQGIYECLDAGVKVNLQCETEEAQDLVELLEGPRTAVLVGVFVHEPGEQHCFLAQIAQAGATLRRGGGGVGWV